MNLLRPAKIESVYLVFLKITYLLEKPVNYSTTEFI